MFMRVAGLCACSCWQGEDWTACDLTQRKPTSDPFNGFANHLAYGMTRYFAGQIFVL